MITAGWFVQSPRASAEQEICRCTLTRQTGGWCGKCKVGYLAGVRVESAGFFEALDAHGHDIDPAMVRCDTCRKAYESYGFCERCMIGFVRKQAYFSRLTYYLARGEVKDPKKLTCTTCVRNRDSSGWCETCGIGLVGCHGYKDRKEFEAAARMRELLILAIDEAGRCMTCALAIINDGPCLNCKLSYKDGKKSPSDAP